MLIGERVSFFRSFIFKINVKCESSWGESCVLCVSLFSPKTLPNSFAEFAYITVYNEKVPEGSRFLDGGGVKGSRLFDAFARLIPNFSWCFLYSSKIKVQRCWFTRHYSHLGENGVIVFGKHLL